MTITHKYHLIPRELHFATQLANKCICFGKQISAYNMYLDIDLSLNRQTDMKSRTRLFVFYFKLIHFGWALNNHFCSAADKYWARLSTLALIEQVIWEKEHSEFKPLHWKFEIVSPRAVTEWLGKYISLRSKYELFATNECLRLLMPVFNFFDNFLNIYTLYYFKCW